VVRNARKIPVPFWVGGEIGNAPFTVVPDCGASIVKSPPETRGSHGEGRRSLSPESAGVHFESGVQYESINGRGKIWIFRINSLGSSVTAPWMLRFVFSIYEQFIHWQSLREI
jgi:hypothetical protein